MKEDSVASVAVSGRFNTTHWSVVLQAGNGASEQSSAALEKLCRTYWLPLYAHIRRQGFGEQDAQDLTQQFFAMLLERKDFETVDRSKGKFRTFLLASLTHFLSNERDRARAAKRGGGQVVFSLDEAELGRFDGLEAASQLTPDKLFDLRWATTVMENALNRLQEEMHAAEKGSQFEELKKYLSGDPVHGEYAASGEGLGLTGQAVAVRVHRLRARYRELVRAEVAETVSSPLELEEEMRHLYEALNQ